MHLAPSAQLLPVPSSWDVAGALERWRCCRKCSHSNTFHPQFITERRGSEWKGLWSTAPLCSPTRHHFQGHRLADWYRKIACLRNIRSGFPVCSQLEHPQHSSLKESSGLIESAAFGGLHMVLLPSDVWDCLFASRWSPVLSWPPGFCDRGVSWRLCSREGEGMAPHMLSFFFAMYTWQSSSSETAYKWQ